MLIVVKSIKYRQRSPTTSFCFVSLLEKESHKRKMSFRKTWDKEFYEKKAKERIEQGDDDEKGKPQAQRVITSSTKEEFVPASAGAQGPSGSARAFLKAREHKVDLESKAGKSELFTPAVAETRRGLSGPGYHCEVCQCTLKDSASYLDHINGKKHLRALGFSMRVERSDTNQVQERLAAIKRKMEGTYCVMLLPATSLRLPLYYIENESIQ